MKLLDPETMKVVAQGEPGPVYMDPDTVDAFVKGRDLVILVEDDGSDLASKIAKWIPEMGSERYSNLGKIVDHAAIVCRSELRKALAMGRTIISFVAVDIHSDLPERGSTWKE